MNKRIKKKWLKALRSGEYVQGKGALCQKGAEYDKFCCLGVLTDLFLIEKGKGWDAPPNSLAEYGVKEEGGEQLYILPDIVSKWADVDQMPKVGYLAVATLNDHGSSFKEIANLIEKHL